jgi:hypothetical protein
MSETDLERTLYWWRHCGDISLFLWTIRSDRPLTASDRNLIADFIEEKIKRPRGRLPGLRSKIIALRNLPLRAAAVECDRLKDEWRKNGGPAGTRRSELPRLALTNAAGKYGVRVDSLAARMRLPLSKRYN